MFHSDIAFYVGAEKDDGYSGYLAEQNYFLILEIEEGITPEEGRTELQKIKQQFAKQTISHLEEFEHLVSAIVKEHHVPSGLSLSAGYINENALYVKTIGSGCVFLQRRNQFARLIGSNQVASGYIESGDLFVFTTSRFIEKNGGEDELKKSLHHQEPHQIVEGITPKIKSDDDQGLIALFAKLKKQEEPLFVSNVKPWDKAVHAIQQLYVNTQNSMGGDGKRKTYTLVAVMIIFIILVWSVGFGYTRRKEASISAKILASKTSIQQKLGQADQEAFLNLPHSLLLIADARQELEQLKGDIPKSKAQELAPLANLITDEENKIVKKENKSYEEFFDLQVDSKQAKGTKLFLDVDSAVILDKGQGVIYTLSLPKKSLTKQEFLEIKTAQLVSGYQNTAVFYTGNGIYKINTDGKISKVIDKDADWSSIVGLWIYNGNLYVLDKGKDIYKYLVTDNGYSAKSSYLKSATSLQDANSLAIDSSVYVGFSDSIVKFTAGVQDDFKTSYPDQNVHITKVFTTKDLEKVYAWDNQKGAMYILGKDGTYEKEIDSNVFKQADDFIVYNNVIYILSGSKIYSISL